MKVVRSRTRSEPCRLRPRAWPGQGALTARLGLGRGKKAPTRDEQALKPDELGAWPLEEEAGPARRAARTPGAGSGAWLQGSSVEAWLRERAGGVAVGGGG